MFTGIIEEIGTVRQISQLSQTLLLTINASTVLGDVKLGDSIAVNGVCLTVTRFDRQTFSADVMPVTFRDTGLAKLKNGSLVNLERAMAANGRFGGHIVSGHVDGVGKISQKHNTGNAIIYTITMDKKLASSCLKKGSIAIDGTSLTIMDCGNDWVQISIIPHTQEKSIIGNKNIGDLVNIECDILAKQLSSQTKISTESKISSDFLKEHGFL